MTNLKRPLVSVIIPFLNGGDWLKEAIESVIGQSYTNWEIFLIDDGSTDDHSNVALDYNKRYPGKIIYKDHPGHVNKGVTVSRNLGITFSSGDYLAFLDSDDRWLPEKLQNQLELFATYPRAGMICEASIFWYSWENPSRADECIRVGAEPDVLYAPPELISQLYPFGKGAPPCPTGIIIKKEVFDRSGGFEESFSGNNQLYEDQAFLFKIYLHEKVFISGAANNFYRKRRGSLTESADDIQHYYRVRKFFFDYVESYLAKHSIQDLKIAQLLHQARTEIKDSGSE